MSIVSVAVPPVAVVSVKVPDVTAVSKLEESSTDVLSTLWIPMLRTALPPLAVPIVNSPAVGATEKFERFIGSVESIPAGDRRASDLRRCGQLRARDIEKEPTDAPASAEAVTASPAAVAVFPSTELVFVSALAAVSSASICPGDVTEQLRADLCPGNLDLQAVNRLELRLLQL